MKIMLSLILLKYFNMKICNTVALVYSFSLKANLIVKTTGEITNLSNTVLYHLENSRFIFYVNENNCFILNNRNLGYKIENNQLNLFDSSNKLVDYNNNYLLLYNREKGTKSVYSISKCKYIWEKQEEIGYFITENFLATDFNSNIKLTNILSGKTIINYSLQSLGKWSDGVVEKSYQVTEFIDVYKNILVCSLNNGGILLLDIINKKTKQFFEDANLRGGLYKKKINSSTYIGLKHLTFIEIDIEKGKIIRKINLENQLKHIANIEDSSPCWLTIGTSVYQDGMFYFYGGKNLLGIFDPELGKIIDHFWFNFKQTNTLLKGGIENLQIKEGKIYCLDTANNLHILDRNSGK